MYVNVALAISKAIEVQLRGDGKGDRNPDQFLAKSRTNDQGAATSLGLDRHDSTIANSLPKFHLHWMHVLRSQLLRKARQCGFVMPTLILGVAPAVGSIDGWFFL